MAPPDAVRRGHAPSVSLQLAVLALLLLAVPVALAWQIERYEARQHAVLHRAVSQQIELTAALLRPRLENFDEENGPQLNNAMAAAAVGRTRIKLLLRPARQANDDFTYVAAYPQVSAAYLARERAELSTYGLFSHLATACDRPENLDVRFTNPAGKAEVLTALIPIHTAKGCWIVLTSENAANFAAGTADQPFWNSPALRLALIVYVPSAILIFWLLLHLRANVKRFRDTARRIRLRGPGPDSFRDANTIPELAGVAEDFDAIVHALTRSQAIIRQAAEENAHALKTPLATIAQSLEPLRRTITPGDASATRSLELIERSVIRLDALVSSARDLDEAAAEVIYPEARPVDLSGFVAALADSYDEALALQKKRLNLAVAPGLIAYANEDLLEPVLENLLENAASFTREGGIIELSLSREEGMARLTVTDQGPGADPAALPRLFERYASFRPASAESGHHQGLGLWIVKRNVEGLGGRVAARNRGSGGFEVTVWLRLKT